MHLDGPFAQGVASILSNIYSLEEQSIYDDSTATMNHQYPMILEVLK